MNKQIFFWIGLLAVLLYSQSGLALDNVTVGGCNDPKNMNQCWFDINCPGGTYATGFIIGKGQLIDSIQLICANPMNTTARSFYSEKAGGLGGVQDNFQCKDWSFNWFFRQEQYLTGFFTYISLYNKVYSPSQLKAVCDGIIMNYPVYGWGTNGLIGPYLIQCPVGEVVTGMKGQAGIPNTYGSYIYSIKSVTCKPKP